MTFRNFYSKGSVDSKSIRTNPYGLDLSFACITALVCCIFSNYSICRWLKITPLSRVLVLYFFTKQGFHHHEFYIFPFSPGHRIFSTSKILCNNLSVVLYFKTIWYKLCYKSGTIQVKIQMVLVIEISFYHYGNV